MLIVRCNQFDIIIVFVIYIYVYVYIYLFTYLVNKSEALEKSE